MFTIREGVFETNSSSSHSIALNPKRYSNYEAKFYMFKTDDSGNVKVLSKLGEYGWGYDILDSPDEKLSYILTMIVCGSDANTLQEIYDSNEFKEVEECVIKNTEFDGIIIDNIDPNHIDDGSYYIDHQSFYSNYKDFLNDYDLTLEEYLFNSRYSVIIDNDNH